MSTVFYSILGTLEACKALLDSDSLQVSISPLTQSFDKKNI